MPIKTSSIRNYIHTSPLQECSRKNIGNKIKELESKSVQQTQSSIARASSTIRPYKLVTNLFQRVRVALFSSTAEQRNRAIARLNTFVALASSAQTAKEKNWYENAIKISLAKCEQTKVAPPRDALSKTTERNGLTASAYMAWENYCKEKMHIPTFPLSPDDVVSNNPFSDIGEAATVYSTPVAPAENCINPFGDGLDMPASNNSTPFDPNDCWSL